MCTLIALHRRIPGVPLAVAANRDEFIARPAEGPALRPTRYGVILAPLDVQAGGTWFGLNTVGLFAAVTNRRGGEPDPRCRSRGLLVIDALAEASACEAVERIESLAAEAYNPFTVFVADAEQAFAVTYDGSPRRIEFGPGAHVIGNVDPLGPPTPKLARLREKAERAAAASADTVLDELARICRGHDGGGNPLDDTCVHAGGYGTRSSALLRLADADYDSVFLYADGAPCSTEYEDFTPLLRGLSRGYRVAEGESGARKVS